jgi:predicted membrane-bound mannosyltransferase/DNA-binding beta-propeller fold protein YncE
LTSRLAAVSWRQGLKALPQKCGLLLVKYQKSGFNKLASRQALMYKRAFNEHHQRRGKRMSETPIQNTEESTEKTRWLDKQLSPVLPWLTVEVVIFTVIALLTVVTRFYDLETRVMSHDESLHTYYSWTYSQGQGYVHMPMMHGPLQFHMIALSYFMFGANDFTARIPAVLFSIATVWGVWYWRRYLGRVGVILAGLMMVVSPYMLFYGRYVRNEAFVGLFGLLTLFAVLRYLETGLRKYLYLLAAATVLHYTAKETAFIYTAQMLLFLAGYFVIHILNEDWGDKRKEFKGFIAGLITGVIGIGGALWAAITSAKGDVLGAHETVAPALPGVGLPEVDLTANILILALVIVGLAGMGIAAYFLISGFSMERVRQERSLDMLMILGTLVLPMLSPILIVLAGFDPLDTSQEGIIHILLFVVPVSAASILVGYWWNWRVWWRAAVLFYAIFIVFYTSLFTNGSGLFTGLVGSLGYWLEQQGVERGSQPWYYYLLIQIPIYEFLPFLASLLGLGIGYQRLRQASRQWSVASRNLFNTYSLLAWWAFSSIAAYSIAGEKMPWLTVHIALPLILFGAWALGNIIEKIDWQAAREKSIWLVLALLAVFTVSTIGAIAAWFNAPRPFSGSALHEIQATTTFILAIIGLLASGYGLVRLLEGWSFRQLAYLNALIFFSLLAVLTARASFRATYVTYDSGREYLVYAHGYTGVKDVLGQVEQLSNRLTGGMDIVVAYDDEVSWPMSWYMIDYRNARFYGNQPGRDLRDAPAIIVGTKNFSKIEPIVGDAYHRFDYIRMVWPNQDYFGLTSERVRTALATPEILAGIFDIWLHRDFTRYGLAVDSVTDYPIDQNVFQDSGWQPSDRMRLYIRKDVAASIWQYGSVPAIAPVADPYEGGEVVLFADLLIGVEGLEPGQFNAPRGLAIAPNGDIYVADSRNHRVQQFSPDGQFIRAWGSFSGGDLSLAAPGTFNEPWGIAVAPDGSVYVSDTWNHRIQKFTSSGEYVSMWGVFGLADMPGGLYGPRGITVDSLGRVFVADTGNKRILIYDPDGNLLDQFGGEGFELGQLYEPVDVKLDSNGLAYVTDTWNQRIQVFMPFGEGTNFTAIEEWPVAAWYSESLENKPYLAIRPNGNVLITDPEGYRIIELTSSGEFVRTWGDYGMEDFAFILPSGIASDADGNIWVSDAGGNRLMHFQMP